MPGLMPTSPVHEAGMRIEPMPSLPCAMGTMPGGDRRGRPAGRAARGPRAVPRVAGDAVHRVGGAEDAQLRHPGDAHDDGTRGAQPRDDLVVARLRGRVGGGRAVAHRLARDGDVVLDRHRDACQRQGLARRHARVDRAGLAHCGLAAYDLEGGEVAVAGRDALEREARRVGGAHRPGAHGLGDRGRGPHGKLVGRGGGLAPGAHAPILLRRRRPRVMTTPSRPS